MFDSKIMFDRFKTMHRLIGLLDPVYSLNLI